MNLLSSFLLALLVASPLQVLSAPPDWCCCEDSGGTCLGFKKKCTSGRNTNTCSGSSGECDSGICNNSCECVTSTTPATTTTTTTTTTETTASTVPATTTAGVTTTIVTPAPDGCASSLEVMCVGWVRGRSGKLHALVKVGGVYPGSDSMVAVNGADVVYETFENTDFNTRVETKTGDSVFKGYQGDYIAGCGESFDGTTGEESCFETTPAGSECTLKVTAITLPGCPNASFTPKAKDGTCVYAGKSAASPCEE